MFSNASQLLRRFNAIMMIKIQGKIPHTGLAVAVSGGVDSMAALDFLRRSRDVTVLNFDHGTEYSAQAAKVVAEYAKRHQLTLLTASCVQDRSPGQSWEEYWREQRYAWFHSLDFTVVMAHHLDDCVETWLWSACHGYPRVIPYRNRNVIRPFRLTTKQNFEQWAQDHEVPWVSDPSNTDVKYMRNYIRSVLRPQAEVVNPGLAKTVGKKINKESIDTEATM
jgi:tRNA(Ile)-lysidine synthase